MKKFIILSMLSCLVAVAGAQPLLKTHVETGDVQGVADGNDLAI